MEIYRFFQWDRFFPWEAYWTPISDDSSRAKSEERSWGALASDVYGIAKWIFEAFQSNLIVCHLSSNISEADRAIETTISTIHTQWFNAETIPFSSRMNREALIVGLKTQGEANRIKIIAEFLGGSSSSELSIEDFVNRHVMTLPEGETRKIDNPTKYAFWLCREDLKQSILTIEEGVRQGLMVKLGRGNDTIDGFVAYCGVNMHLLRAQLEALSSS